MDITSLSYLLEILLKTYFFNSRCLFIFTDTNLQINFAIPFIYLKVNETLIPELIFHHFGCQDIMVHHENAAELFVQFEKLIRLKNERFSMRKFIISGRNSTEIFEKQEALHHIADIIVVVPSFEEQKYNLMTLTYQTGRRDLETVILDCWFPKNKSFQLGTHLFPDKLKNQNGRIVKLATFTYAPYSIVVGNDSFHGTEANFFVEFAKRYNLTLEYIVLESEFLWGNIYPNWTGNGVRGKVLDDEADIGYAGLYFLADDYKYLDFTKSIIRSGVTVIVPTLKLETGWLTPLRSFSNRMWEAVLLVFLADTILLSYIFYRDQNLHYFQDSLITIMKLYLLQSVKFPLRNRILKYFMALNMINVLLLSSSYGSGLSSILTVPKYKNSIKTVDDLASQGLYWGATTEDWLGSLRYITSENYQIIKSNFIVKSETDLIKASKSHNFGFAIERLPYGQFAVGEYFRGDVVSNYQVMTEDLCWEQVSYAVRKSSVLLPILNALLLHVFEAGLGTYWQNEAVIKHMDMKVQQSLEYQYKKQLTVKLRLDHVQGAFGVLLLGYFISIVVFLVEMIHKKELKETQIQ